MKRIATIALAAVSLLAPFAAPQQPVRPLVQLKASAVTRTHVVGNAATITAVLWTWTAPAVGANGVSAATYNFYQAAGLCPVSGLPTGAAKLTGGLVTSDFTQSPAPAATTCSYVTAVSQVGVEGPASNTFQLNLGAPGAPTGFTGSPTTN
jgi:hypothetical protein